MSSLDSGTIRAGRAIVLLCLCIGLAQSRASFFSSKFPSADDSWENELALAKDGSFILQWTPSTDRILFRVTARTGGYIGFGLSSKPKMNDADIVVGWVHSGKAYLQDRHGRGNQAPRVDKQQDWDLIGGFENDTHTVLIMSRPYVTCDSNDHPITNDTIHLLWAFHPDDPVDPESPRPRLHYHGGERRGTVALFLMQRPFTNNQNHLPLHHHRKNFHLQMKDTPILSWSLVKPPITIEHSADSVHWCRIFEKPRLSRKHHITRYEPVITPENRDYVHHMMLYECTRLSSQKEDILYKLSRTSGGMCANKSIANFLLSCNHVLVAWSLGSQGVWLPPEAGYPLTIDGPKFYILETHYDLPKNHIFKDGSGIRLEHTPSLRAHDAGVLSVGLDPNWKHLIPPGKSTVTSEGHCIKECLEESLPPSGINIFGVIFHTHLLGREVRLRHIRGTSELEPIAKDSNYQFEFQEFRAFREARQVIPGDHLIGECMYNSEERSSITLGGFKTRDEMCLSYIFYYPRMDLSFCHSKPSLGTVLQSLGIEELSDEQNHITIKKPKELAGKSLKWRLQNYDWINQFEHFQHATRVGTFNPLCINRGGIKTQNSGDYEYKYPDISRIWKQETKCESGRTIRHQKKEASDTLNDETPSKPIEMIDVDPIRNYDVFMPVIGVEPEQDPLNEFVQELEEVEREFEDEFHNNLEFRKKNIPKRINTPNQAKPNVMPERTKTKAMSAAHRTHSYIWLLVLLPMLLAVR